MKQKKIEKIERISGMGSRSSHLAEEYCVRDLFQCFPRTLRKTPRSRIFINSGAELSRIELLKKLENIGDRRWNQKLFRRSHQAGEYFLRASPYPPYSLY